MRRLLPAALAVLSFASLGCADAGTGLAAVSGTYTLRTIDGDPVPATLAYTSPSDHVEVLEAQLRLTSDGRYTDRTRVSETRAGVTTEYLDDTDGQWTLTGEELVLVDDADRTSVTRGTLSDGRITIRGYGGTSATAVFSR